MSERYERMLEAGREFWQSFEDFHPVEEEDAGDYVAALRDDGEITVDAFDEEFEDCTHWMPLIDLCRLTNALAAMLPEKGTVYVMTDEDNARLQRCMDCDLRSGFGSADTTNMVTNDGE